MRVYFPVNDAVVVVRGQHNGAYDQLTQLVIACESRSYNEAHIHSYYRLLVNARCRRLGLYPRWPSETHSALIATGILEISR